MATRIEAGRLVRVVRRSDCSHGQMAIDAIDRLAGRFGLVVRVDDVVIDTDEQAKAYRCLGSPTLLVGGADVEVEARGRTDFAVT